MNPTEAFVVAWNQIATLWAESTLHGLAVAVPLAVLVWIVSRFVGRYLRPHILCWLWWLLAAKLAFSVVGAFLALPRLNLPVLPAGVVRGQFAAVAGLDATSSPTLPPPAEFAESPVTQPQEAAAVSVAPTPTAWVFLLWGTGMAVGLIVASHDARRLAQTVGSARSLNDTPLASDLRLLAVTMGINSSPRLAESPAVSAPLVTGLRRPLILVPEGFAESLTPEETQMALAHELAHLRRADLLLALVPFVMQVSCFFLPFVPGLVLREWATAREAACDALAVSATGATPGVYSRLLLKVVAQDHRPVERAAVALGATASFHTLNARIDRVRHLSTPVTPTLRATAVLSAGFVTAALIVLLAPWHLSMAQGQSAPATLATAQPFPLAEADVADVPTLDIRGAGGDRDKRYLLVGAGKGMSAPPPNGYRLLVILPGGDGSANFNGFIRRIHKFALSQDYLVAQPIAKVWDERQASQVVWPLRTNPWPSMRFSTEEFITAVIDDVKARYPVNPRYISVLGWASGGPAAYAAALSPDCPVTGAFVAMSVYGHDFLPSPEGGKGRAVFVLQPSDTPMAPLSMAHTAVADLKAGGAKVELVTYDGGYGWRGNIYAQIRRGVHFLEKNDPSP